jgi:hypothetical protein
MSVSLVLNKEICLIFNTEHILNYYWKVDRPLIQYIKSLHY